MYSSRKCKQHWGSRSTDLILTADGKQQLRTSYAKLQIMHCVTRWVRVISPAMQLLPLTCLDARGTPCHMINYIIK